LKFEKIRVEENRKNGYTCLERRVISYHLLACTKVAQCEYLRVVTPPRGVPQRAATSGVGALKFVESGFEVELSVDAEDSHLFGLHPLSRKVRKTGGLDVRPDKVFS
jgi:hypothetical protein